jgi:hypothetical protein
MKAAIDGTYVDPFFENARTTQGYTKRLRAVIQNHLTEFEEDMRTRGQTKKILDSNDSKLGENEISRDDYIKDVKTLMRRSRGRELPGTFDPLIIGELFKEQCSPWKGIADRRKDGILEAVYSTIRTILNHIAVEGVVDGVFRIISSGLDHLTNELNHKMTEIFRPHENGHPVTYNHHLTDTVQKAQANRRQQALKQSLESFFGRPRSKDAFHAFGTEVNIPELSKVLEHRTEVDMERFASESAVDYMQACYKVRLT